MPERPVSVLHAIHDFLPRHRAGSEIYLLSLCRELQNRHPITVLCADYAAGRDHGSLTWRLVEGVTVVELTNNWEFTHLSDSYRSPLIGSRLREILGAVQPDVVHVHSLLNLSFELPAIAREIGIPVVATLHDYTLVCPSGGQRLHRAEQHVCHTIDVDRCARCFRESAFYDLMMIGRLSTAARVREPIRRLAHWVSRSLPSVLVRRAAGAIGRATGPTVTPRDISQRLDAVDAVFDDIDLFVAPSRSMAEQYRRLGLPDEKLQVADYGFSPLTRRSNRSRADGLRFGYVGSLVWHKGVHVLLDSLKRLPAHGWQLAIFGDPAVSPEYVASLSDSAAGLPVRFMGAFGEGETAEVYGQIDVLVVPSLWLENSPLVIHEAFMTGVPVVGASVGGIPDLITDGVNGLLYDPASPDALAAALRTLIDDPDRVQRLADRAPAVTSIRHDAKRWERIYEDAMAGGAS